MKIVITGGNGTVGKEMKKYMESIGNICILWDRKKISPYDYYEMKSFLEKENPDILFHFAIASLSTGIENESWKINFEWSSELAWICKELNIKFLITSTAMVFTDKAIGPFTKNSIPDAYEGYGYEKKCAEERVIFQNSKSYIVRLGWQIGNEYFGNNMLAYFEEQQNIKGYVAASKKWFPACSFVKDSVREIYRIVTKEDPGIFMIDSNDRFNFFEIAEILNKKNGKRWKIIEDNSFIFEQRMVDFNCRIIKFSEMFEVNKVMFSEKYLDGEYFHNKLMKIYMSENDKHFKKDENMVKVKYFPCHGNKEYNDEKKGIGNTFVKWVYSEESSTKENFFNDNLINFHDTVMEPYSVIGLHYHNNNEIYYILEGEIEAVVLDSDNKETSMLLSVGDAHAVLSGESHFIRAGNYGARFIVCEIKN